MKNYSVVILKFFYLLLLANCVLASNINRNIGFKEQFAEIGYVEICNKELLKTNFANLYFSYSYFYREFQNNAKLRHFLTQADKSFTEQKVAKYFASAPLGYRYFENHGKINKSFYHFSKEYYEFLQNNYQEQLEEFAALENLLLQLQVVDSYAHQKFSNLISEMQKEHTGIEEVMYQDRNQLTIITKVVRYDDFAGTLSSHPHYDFSGFTLILDNSDPDDEGLLLSKYKEDMVSLDFHKVERIYGNNAKYSSVLFLPGIALKLMGIDISPTPHMVKAVDKPRFAVISFAMIPYKKVDYRQIRVKVANLKEKVRK